MLKHVLTSVLLFGFGHFSLASSTFYWTEEKFALVNSGNSDRGGQLVEENRCSKCHNETGISDDEDIPSIAGQRASYLYKQLDDYKSGTRENRDMKKATRKLSEQDMADISAWYSKNERAPMLGGEPMLVVKVCDSCHNDEIIVEDDHIEVAPILEGQIRNYLVEAMQAFKQADRHNDLFSRMQSVSLKLTDTEIEKLATFYGAKDPE